MRRSALPVRPIHILSAVKVASLKRAGYYADGGNLYLRIAPGGSNAWIFRYALSGKTRDAGDALRANVGV
jgi:hypothetical protein